MSPVGSSWAVSVTACMHVCKGLKVEIPLVEQVNAAVGLPVHRQVGVIGRDSNGHQLLVAHRGQQACTGALSTLLVTS